MGFLSRFCRKDNWIVPAKIKKKYHKTHGVFFVFSWLEADGGDTAYFIPSKTRESFIHVCVMQLSGWVAQDAGLAQPENLGAHWQPQKEMLLCKPGTKETKKKVFQTSSISHGAWKLVRHITPPGALIFPHGSTREAASRLYSFNFAFPFTNSRQNWSHSFSSLWQCPKIPLLKLRERKETSTRLLSIISPRFFYVEAEIFVPLHCYHCFDVNVHHVLHREPSQFSNMQKTTQNRRRQKSN